MTYSVTVVARSQGTVSLLVPANVITDLAGNGNSATAPAAVIYSVVGPTYTITANSPSNVVVFTVIFNTIVTDFTDSSDNAAILAALNNSYSCTIAPIGLSGTTFSISVTPLADGIVSLLFPANVATNGLNGNLAATFPTNVLLVVSNFYDMFLKVPEGLISCCFESGSSASSMFCVYAGSHHAFFAYRFPNYVFEIYVANVVGCITVGLLQYNQRIYIRKWFVMGIKCHSSRSRDRFLAVSCWMWY